jgi:Heme/copper-type cytochrome/quinol oxidases, subunit 2
MNIDFYERIWMWAAGVIIAIFIVVIGASTVAYGLHPPSHIETIEPSKIFTDPRFSKLGAVEMPDGTIEVQMVAIMFAFAPNEVRVPAGRPIRFRLTSADVTHGFMIARTNANTMLVPGYISQFTTVFPRPGDYLVVCHEFCGNGHHVMSGRIIVEESK